MILVQASSLSWSGGPDRCVRLLDGKTLVVRSLERLSRLFPGTPIRIVAPEYDSGGLDDAAKSVPNCSASYAFDDKPLKRLLRATANLDDDALVLRVDGQHCFFDETTVAVLLQVAARENLHLAKFPDDFPPPLTAEVWRVSGLRHIDKILSGKSVDDAAAHYVHPKFLAMRAQSGLRTKIVESAPVGEERLRDIRASLMRAFDEDHNEVTPKAIAAGDMVSFHYVVAKQHLNPKDRVLDIASGKGMGGNIMADQAASVVCADLDEEKLEEGARLFARQNMTFQREDVMNISCADASFDVVVSMETIEHMDNVDGYLAELRRVLKPSGRAILSTPQNRLGRVPLTPAHVHEFTLDELRACCERHFTVEKVLGIKAGTIYFEDDPIGTNSMIFLRA